MAEASKILTFSDQEYERRYLKIREGMQLRDIDCLVITGNDDSFGAAAADLVYITGQRPMRAVMLTDFVVFPLEGDAVCVSQNLSECKIPTQTPPLKKGKGEGRLIDDWATAIATRIKELGLEKGRIGIVEMRVMPAGVYMELLEHLPQAKFVPAGDILLECRRLKSAEEQEFVRMAGECVDRAFEAIIETVRPGVTEEELFNVAEFAMIKAGARRGNMIGLNAAPWEERLHSRELRITNPKRKLQKGDLITNELCPNYNGYFVQECIPISIGVAEKNMPDSFKELFQLHKDIYELSKKELRPGTTVTAIEHKVQALFSSRGNFGRCWTLQSCELAEAHFTTNYVEIKPGMTWVSHPHTMPPPGEPGHRGPFLGNTLLVTEGEPEVISRLPLDLVVI